MKVSTGRERVRLEGLYVRVSGSHGQESSLQAQEKELRATSTGEDFVSLVTTFAGRLYGMRSAENRRRLLAESEQCQAGSHQRAGNRSSPTVRPPAPRAPAPLCAPAWMRRRAKS
ncbi:hypothetical protein [Streptomyces sp. CA-106110]|uniref:hypothetical protein n=2 Tax=unclassified Streptomyces TaxID=2593676 RepID=UPI003D89B28C